jgi:Flp pilus assembly protein TadG
MKTKGQALVEMAIVIVILFMLVLGIFQFGWLMYIKNSLNNAARAGARFAVVLPPHGSLGKWSSADIASIINYTKNCLYYGIDPSDVTVTVTDTTSDQINENAAPVDGHAIEVNATLNSIPQFLPTKLGEYVMPRLNTLSGKASMRYE